jgi:tRNA G18 (ribose-2'-O)-methylase SpoU
LRERAARLVSLPIASSVESLNVAVATGILLYELRA